MNFCIGPMSKNTVDAIANYCLLNNEVIGFIPSRRQIEYIPGYVNNWTTKSFHEYLCSKTDNDAHFPFFIQRDHGGPGQGQSKDDNDFERSLDEDCQYLDSIHIDPWKRCKDIQTGAEMTATYINFCLQRAPFMLFEVGTEQAIFPMSTEQLNEFLSILKNLLGDKFNQIEFVVVQGGTALKAGKNIGTFNEKRLHEMTEIAKDYGLSSKEHNGDYLTNSEIARRFELGLDCLNIAPEFGSIESQIIIDSISPEDFEIFFNLCIKSNHWCKWFPEGFDPKSDKRSVLLATGHYAFSNPEMISILAKYNLDNRIKKTIYSRLEELHDIVKSVNNSKDHKSPDLFL